MSSQVSEEFSNGNENIVNKVNGLVLVKSWYGLMWCSQESSRYASSVVASVL